MPKVYQLKRTQLIAKPLDDVFEFFSNAANLESLTPSFLKFRILTPEPIEMAPGTRIDYALSLFGIPLRWRTHITCWEPGVRFVDEQESGPYRLWRHLHEFEARGASTLIRDQVDYSLPMGPLGRIAHAVFVGRTLNRIFDFRQQSTRRLLDEPNKHVNADDQEKQHVSRAS